MHLALCQTPTIYSIGLNRRFSIVWFTIITSGREINPLLKIISEQYDFWQTKRKNSLGLSSYGTHGSDAEIMLNYKWHHCRVFENGATDEEKMQIGRDIMAIAESGLDFNMRFKTSESRIAAHEFSHLDLDCILYDAEIKTAEMLRLLNRESEAETFEKNAENRK